MQQTRQELEEQALLWQHHLKQQQRQPKQYPPPSQAPSGLALPNDLAPYTTWASLSTPFRTAITANWVLIESSAVDINAQVSVRRHADIASAEQDLGKAEELALLRKITLAEARDAAASAERASDNVARLPALLRYYGKPEQRGARGTAKNKLRR